MQSEVDKTELFSRDATSIAPLAVDLGIRPAKHRRAESDVAAPSGGASQRGWILAALGAIAALSLVSGLAMRVPPPPHALGQPHAHRVVAAHEAVLIPVLTAPAKDLIVLDEDASSTIPVSALPTPRAAVTTTRASHVGLLRLPPSVKGILVDGAPRRVERGIVSLPCGTHTIKAPSQPARPVTIACAATTML